MHSEQRVKVEALRAARTEESGILRDADVSHDVDEGYALAREGTEDQLTLVVTMPARQIRR